MNTKFVLNDGQRRARPEVRAKMSGKISLVTGIQSLFTVEDEVHILGLWYSFRTTRRTRILKFFVSNTEFMDKVPLVTTSTPGAGRHLEIHAYMETLKRHATRSFLGNLVEMDAIAEHDKTQLVEGNHQNIISFTHSLFSTLTHTGSTRFLQFLDRKKLESDSAAAVWDKFSKMSLELTRSKNYCQEE